ncbi:MAG: ABC transporter permease [Candidatus Dadabacteria bacterium]|nr:ABC transporter permease [Candidatus Dadabacteria bacterium]TDI89143.1 MAG: ABC transporter permease [Candidatus Dadabacteria bacterium]TDI99047.1 MAG: ABC transporter permease [Candidatus Dadabacteria bacterium]
MRDYIFKRLLLLIPTLFGITLITFFIIQLAPGNPVERKLQLDQGIQAEAITQQIVEETRKLYGLDKPIYVRYWIWVKQIATLDFGRSYKDHRPVINKIAERIPITLTLNIISIILIYLIAIPIGVYSAVAHGRFSERVSTFFLFMLYSIPSFWMAMILIFFLGGGDYWDIFPVYGILSPDAENYPFFKKALNFLWHIILPVFCLTYGGLAYLSRFQKGSLLEVLREDFVRTATAKGLPRHIVIFKHALRNALIPIITILAGLLPAMIGGSVIIESIFSIPGIGQLGFESVLSRDYPVIMGIATISAVLTLIGILIADLIYVLVDPRISFEAKK